MLTTTASEPAVTGPARHPLGGNFWVYVADDYVEADGGGSPTRFRYVR